MNITVLLGGVSAERDVSLSSGLRIAIGLREKGHTVTCLDPADGVFSREKEVELLASGVGSNPPSLEQLANLTAQSLSPVLGTLPEITNADCVFIALHGGQGEDGTVQAVLRAAGVATADWLMAPHPSSDHTLRPEDVGTFLGWPVIVKPSKQGSTVGLSIVRNPSSLALAIKEAFRFDDEVMVERFVPGRELTVAVLGGKTMPTIEIEPVKELYDYECKYTPGMAKEYVAELTAETHALLSEQSLKAFSALKLRGYARIDFRLDPNGQSWCLEANTLPGMTPTSLIPQAAAAAGVLFPELCESIVQLALQSRSTASTAPAA